MKIVGWYATTKAVGVGLELGVLYRELAERVLVDGERFGIIFRASLQTRLLSGEGFDFLSSCVQDPNVVIPLFREPRVLIPKLGAGVALGGEVLLQL